MHRITSQDFSGVRAGWTHEQTYTYLNVDRRTYERWLSGRSRIPFMAYELLRIVVAGQLPATGKDWHGWRFYDGKLFSPEGVAYAEGEIRAILYQYALIRELKLQLRLAHEENARISLGEAWQGWRFIDEKLISPEGMEYFQWEIRALPFLHTKIAELLQHVPPPQHASAHNVVTLDVHKRAPARR